MPATEPMRIGAERGYPLFERNARAIEDRGIVSALAIFDDQSEPMYVDNCCHYSKAGETILADFVAKAVVRSLQKPPN